MTDLADDLIPMLAGATPAGLLATLQVALQRSFGALGVELYLPDYAQTMLHPVSAGASSSAGPLPIAGSAVGRAYASERLGLERDEGRARACVPLVAQGERLGVLSLSLPAMPGPDRVARLTDAGRAIAAALVVAGDFTDVFERVRRSRPLTVAAELQWQLLPGAAHRQARFSVAGHLEPAYSVAGDAYDWSADGERLTLAVLDGSGRGVPSALGTCLAVTALRNARRSGSSLADQAALADQALYAQYGGDLFVAAVVLELDLVTGRAQAIDAGSPALFRLRGSELTELTLDHQLPLGMFDETLYRPEPVEVEPGDRLLLVTDGVHGAGPNETFGERRLARAIRDTRLLPTAEAVRHVMLELHGHLDHTALADDAVVVALDLREP